MTILFDTLLVQALGFTRGDWEPLNTPPGRSRRILDLHRLCASVLLRAACRRGCGRVLIIGGLAIVGASVRHRRWHDVRIWLPALPRRLLLRVTPACSERPAQGLARRSTHRNGRWRSVRSALALLFVSVGRWPALAGGALRFRSADPCLRLPGRRAVGAVVGQHRPDARRLVLLDLHDRLARQHSIQPDPVALAEKLGEGHHPSPSWRGPCPHRLQPRAGGDQRSHTVLYLLAVVGFSWITWRFIETPAGPGSTHEPGSRLRRFMDFVDDSSRLSDPPKACCLLDSDKR